MNQIEVKNCIEVTLRYIRSLVLMYTVRTNIHLTIKLASGEYFNSPLFN